MKIVIDTNVLVSAALRNRNPGLVIQFIVDHPEFEWVVSQEILGEYKNVLSRPKFRLAEDLRREWFELIDSVTNEIQITRTVDFPRDQKDAKFLACALAANAEFLITGDLDFTEAQIIGDTIILSASMFKQLMIPEAE